MFDTEDRFNGSPGITRRDVLQATGGVAALGIFGSMSVGGEEHTCKGVEPEQADGEQPIVDIRNDSVSESNLPDDPDEVLIYVYGYDTTETEGEKQVATFTTALENEGYSKPAILVHWDSEPEEEAESDFEEGQNFQEVEANADEAGSDLAEWIESAYPDTTVRLVGYSLGSRVILRAVSDISTGLDIRSASILGPAIASEQICTDSSEFDLSTAGAVYAYNSENDATICDAFEDYLSFFADPDPPAVGCTGATCDDTMPDNFTSRDVTDAIDEHCAYMYPDVGVVPQIAEDFQAAPEPGDDEDDEEDDGEDEAETIESDVVITLDSEGTTAWEVTGLDGDSDVTAVGETNPTLSLESGVRYAFENDGWDLHPLAFRGDGDSPLLSQASEGSYEDDADVNWVDNGDVVGFTVTPALASDLETYVCTVHPSMEGAVETDVSQAEVEVGNFLPPDVALEQGTVLEQATATVTNVGNHSGVASVELRIDGDTRAETNIELDTDEVQEVSFEDIETADLDPDTYVISIWAGGSEAEGTLTVTAVTDDEDTDSELPPEDEGEIDEEEGDQPPETDDTDDTADVDTTTDEADGADDDGPGLGVITAISSLGGIGYVLVQRLSEEESD